MLRAAVHLALDAHRLQLACERRHRLGDVLLALDAPLVEHLGDLPVELGLEEAERQVLQLPLQLPHAQAVRERRIDVERLARVSAAFLAVVLGVPAQGLRAARQPDQHHAHVLDHAEHHLAQDLALLRGVGARQHAQLVELLHAGGEPRDLRAEGFRELFRAAQVLRRGEQHAGRARRRIHADRGEARGDAQGVRPHRLAGGERLSGVQRLGELERARECGTLIVREPGGQRIERGGGALRAQLDDGDHAVL